MLYYMFSSVPLVVDQVDSILQHNYEMHPLQILSILNPVPVTLNKNYYYYLNATDKYSNV